MDVRNKRCDPGEAVVPGLTLAFGIAYLVQTAGAPATAMRWPIIIAAVTGGLWLAIVIHHVFTPRRAAVAPPRGGRERKLSALIVGGPLLYLLILPSLGFAVSTMIFLPALFRALGGRSWGRNVTIAFVMTAVLQIALIGLMRMDLPRLQIGSFVL